MSYYLAPSLAQLRAQINAAWPNRSKASDGWIGDASHSARKSDHNPDYSAGGVVRAIDVTASGIDADAVIAAAVADPRTYYVIHKGVIRGASKFRARKYTGANAHNQHIHISIKHGKSAESGRGWNLGKGGTIRPTGKPKPSKRVKANSGNSGNSNIAIAETLNALGYKAGVPDGVPGPYLRAGVKRYQRAQTYFPGMKRDGDWGPMTQKHFDWTRKALQPNLNKWNAVQRRGLLAHDGDLAKLTKARIKAVQSDNYAKYNKVGGYYKDGEPGPITCRLLGIHKHPSA